jgi:hypothetical protein
VWGPEFDLKRPGGLIAGGSYHGTACQPMLESVRPKRAPSGKPPSGSLTSIGPEARLLLNSFPDTSSLKSPARKMAPFLEPPFQKRHR